MLGLFPPTLPCPALALPSAPRPAPVSGGEARDVAHPRSRTLGGGRETSGGLSGGCNAFVVRFMCWDWDLGPGLLVAAVSIVPMTTAYPPPFSMGRRILPLGWWTSTVTFLWILYLGGCG